MSFCLNVHVYLCACVCFYGFLFLGKEHLWDARDDNDVGGQTKSHKAQNIKTQSLFPVALSAFI